MTQTRIRTIIYLLILFLVVAGLYNLFNSSRYSGFKEVNISDIRREVEKGNVQKIQVDKDEVKATLKDGTLLRTFKEAGEGIGEYGISPDKADIEIADPSKGSLWPTLISVVLPFLLLAGFIYFMIRQAQGANIRALSFGKSQARLASGTKITFADVAGLEESKHELMEVVEFLKHPEKFRQVGAEIPKGILLVGAPGVGKTLMAKAVAGEAGVPFFSISASEFVEMFVGVGAARVRDLFQKAKRNAPTVVFIDELDAIGRQRGAGLGGSHDEREQTLNQILVEMDGFETDARVVILGATNRPDILDPALLRPGRFDRRIVLPPPDKKEREAILKLHAKNKPFERAVDFGKIAASTAGLSGADLKNIVNEAAILAAREHRRTIPQTNFDSAIEKVILGPERKSRVLSPEEKKIAAYHEAGHAIVSRVLKHTDPVEKISVVSRGMALGYTWSLPQEDRYLQSKSKFKDEIAQLLAGRVAEKMVFNELTTGAANDLERATKIAHDMVQIYGMSDKLGPVVLGKREELIFLGRELTEHKNYSEKIAAQIDSEIEAIIGEAERRAQIVLRKFRKVLDKLANLLIEKETVEKEEFNRLFPKLHPAS